MLEIWGLDISSGSSDVFNPFDQLGELAAPASILSYYMYCMFLSPS